ncbi:hypothetical protein [Sphingomonas montanisoli]|uniref:Uncharacterized protein n=1 Tax=Sphingomonas montanisoli TaxID=2606412 RepID=A0A5D9C5G7_9SPHN|nr:hypothetical protein [Sphingomonas montanisoli]TZG26280.1 hypothetical protein FYJ91_15170 [Sphingomonas montanisoli]
MSNTTLIIIAVAVVLVIAVIFLLTRKPTAQVPPASVAKPAAPAPKPVEQPHSGIADGAAAAMLDVAGPVVGVDLNPDLPSDDLTRIKGLGPKAQAVLNSIGIHRYSQLAALDPAQAGEVDGRMGNFKGRIHRDEWVDQARFLEQDDTIGFEAKYGKLG